METIIRNSSELNKSITKQISVGQTYRSLLQVNGISALWHAAKHRDPSHLNRFFKTLEPNDGRAFKLYVAKAHIFMGNNDALPDVALPASQKEDMRKRGQVLDVKTANGETAWRVLNQGDVQDAVKRSEHFVEVIEKTLAPANLPGFPAFYAVDNVQTMAYIGDISIIARIKALGKAVNGESTETRAVDVSPKVKKKVAEFVQWAESFGENDLQADREEAERKTVARPRRGKGTAGRGQEKTSSAERLNA